jgi:predicted acylesterase/phospholipase RssA
MDTPPSPPPNDVPEDLLDCDLVMKGGITSGVVYPKAVTRFACRYRIRSIGGTSVGAIAAALTAAAEYWRQTQSGEQAPQREYMREILVAMEDAAWDSSQDAVADAEVAFTGSVNPHRDRGFAGLYAIPQEIGGNLLGLFRPDRSTRGLFNYLISILRARTAGGKVLAALFREFYVVRAFSAFLFVLMALALLNQPRLGVWISGPVLLLIGLLMLESTFFTQWMRKPTAEPSRRNKAYIAVAVAGVVALGAFLLIERGLGWSDVLESIAGWISDHRWWLAALLVALAVMLAWSRIRAAIVSRFQGDRARTAHRNVNATGVVLLIAFVVISLVASWNWIDDHLGEVGVGGVGFVVGWLLGGAVALVWYLLVPLPRNFNGICTGMGEGALTEWLVARIDRVAGIDDPNRHLTFGDLAHEAISLEAITSDLKRGVPLDIPGALENYRFRPSEFSRLFPASVLRQMGVSQADLASTALVPFPETERIPVVVVARMSLSFPVLFSAVPVYHKHEGTRPLQRNWLSDGGIVSNFPLHKFDRALPPWPTFAIDLISKDEDRPPAITDQVWLNPIRDSGRMEETAQTVSPAAMEAQPEVATGDLLGFAARILDTARGWLDNSQKVLPGYAERIVGVYLYRGEGGLNLDMDAETIRRLSDRGMCGAHEMVRSWEPFDRGETVPGNQWDQHRWLRYRILMREMEKIGKEWTWVFDPESPTVSKVHCPSLAELVKARPHGEAWKDRLVYRWDELEAANEAHDLTRLLDTFTDTTGEGVDLDAAVPQDAALDPEVFGQPRSPALHPMRLMMPPFE